MDKLLFLIVSFFSLHVLGANYYVNNGTYDGDDLYTTAVGNNGNNGQTASTPKLTFANLWATYGPAGTNVITDGDIIYVDAGTYTSASSVTGTCNCSFSFTDDITIQGAGQYKTIFDNNYVGIAGSYYFADITASVTIKDIQFRKYASNQNGQAIQISSTGAPGVTLENVIMNLNGGSSKYAPLYIGSSSTVTITGGGQNCNGDAGHNASGGIDVVGTSITLTISDMSFIGNYKSSSAAVTHGAALSITGADGTTDVTLNNCLFSGNQTDTDGASGGAIYATSGDLVLTDCIIETSDTYELSVKYGGAAYFTGGTQLFTRVLVRDNTNSGGSTYGTVSVHGGALTLADCYFSGNESDRGEDIYCKSGTITATNTTFASAANQTATYGGTITLTNCGTPTNQHSSGTFTNNGGSPGAFTTPTTPTFTGTCAGANVLLPIELISYHARNQENFNRIEWVTNSEYNNDYFLLEKSLDGQTWTEINRQNSLGSGGDLKNYHFNDYGENAAVVYYRLSQKDFDGNHETFPIISLRCNYQEGELYYLNMMGQEVEYEKAPSGIYFLIRPNLEALKVFKP
jgi:predicted outer membrane repeat protein